MTADQILENMVRERNEFEAGVKVLEGGGWISVADRLPINSASEMKGEYHKVVEVIVFDGNTVYASEFQAGCTTEFWGVFVEDDVTHWQELPSPPTN